MLTINAPDSSARPGGAGPPFSRDELGGAQLLLMDVRMRSLLVREVRRRLLTRMFGVPAADQSLLATVVLLGAAAAGLRAIVARPVHRPSGTEAAIGVSLVNTALAAIAGPPARNAPLARAMIGLAVVAHSLRPLLAGSIRDVEYVEPGARAAFDARYGHRRRRTPE